MRLTDASIQWKYPAGTQLKIVPSLTLVDVDQKCPKGGTMNKSCADMTMDARPQNFAQNIFLATTIP